METPILISSNKTITLKEDKGVIDVLINGGSFDFKENPGISNDEKKKYAQGEARNFYSSFLRSQFENLIVLTGAGTSVKFGGKTMGELWNLVEADLTSVVLEELCKAISYVDDATDFNKLDANLKDLEKLLSRAHIAKEFIKEYKGNAINISSLVSKIETIIQTHCKISLQPDAPHQQFLNKITDRKLKDPRAKIFTLNYDTLFEQASIGGNFTVIDGFSFSSPRTLSGRNFDYDIVYREKTRIKEEESFISKVFHLYKPHGSINWEYDAATDSVVINDSTSKPLMIFPKDSKYENSYEQPFFEMMSRLQQNLRKDNVLLITVGFSFNDKHIVTAIKEAVAQNPSFRLLIINRSINKDSFKWFVEKSKNSFNVTLVAEEFSDFVENYPSSSIYSDERNQNFNTNEPKTF